MHMQKKMILAAITCGALLISTPVHADVGPFDFTLRSHEGREWSNSDFQDKQLVVVAFLGTECPLVKLYGPKLQKLNDEFAEKLAVIGMNSNTQDSLTEINAYANRHEITFPFLKDVGNVVADQFDAKRTPEVFLLDADRNVRYRGRIDDQYSVGLIRDAATEHNLRDAIEQLLAGKDVAVPETEAVGCHIGRLQKAEPTGEITYAKHIAPIFNARCVECHRDGELAPFPLTTYDDVLGWEETICEVIADNRMPPWFANPAHGKFKNDCRLSDDEKQLVYDWVDNGMPKGDDKDLPDPPQFAEGWRIPKPDQVFYMRDTPFEVKAQGTISYQHFVVDPGWDEDKYICAAEARPDNKSVVHHILVYVVPEGQERRGGLDRILVGYAPGSTPVELADGVAIKVEAGSRLLFEMHYTPNGYVQSDRSYAGVKFVDKSKVKKLIRGRIAIEDDLEIPPHASNHPVTAEYSVARDELLVSMTPHMHLRGSSFKYEAKYPDGNTEVLLDVPEYDFNWQLKYTLEQPKLLPRGTKVLCTATYNNSASNLVNPDPSKTVRWGDQSWQEMMIGFFDTLPPERTVVAQPSVDPTGAYSWKGRFPGTLRLEMKENVVSGTLVVADGDEVEIEDAVMDGDRLTFSATLKSMRGMTFDFDAIVKQDSIEGTVMMGVRYIGRNQELPWKAERE